MTRLSPQQIIAIKRDRGVLPESAIRDFVAGVTDGSVTEGQIAAWAMAVYLNGMNDAEQAALTRAMLTSGKVIDWAREGLEGPVIDKHSTGGVGDKVSLLLAPIVAACGIFDPMISGRGLGHTGGTLDKLTSIPGYRAVPDLATFSRITREVGCSIIGQTAELAPADRRIYAVRDVTGTIRSLPLITASILSKKLAAGLDGLVMDVKFGSGAFMATAGEARALAVNIRSVAGVIGLPVRTLLTDMNQVLGRTAGNAVEIGEAIAFLTGASREPRLADCTLALAAQMLVLGGLAGDAGAGRAMAARALDDGRAAEVFARMVVAHGGPADFIDKPAAHLPKAPVIRAVHPPTSGRLTRMDVRAVGLAVVELGGGRRRTDEEIDPAVGLSEVAGLGETVGPERPLCLVHAADRAAAERAAARLLDAIDLSDHPDPPTPVVHEIITA